MASYFYIKQGSTLNPLRMELVDDGRFEFVKTSKFNDAIQNAVVTFSMTDENGMLVISNAPCSIVLSNDDSCEEHYVIEYKWNKRDTKKKGIYKGEFTINFSKVESEDGVSYPEGILNMPIYEQIYINVL